jgi:hypothetical protein
MSRSYQKVAGYSQRSHKFGKRQANKRLRHYKDDNIPSKGNWYKKIYESWKICDYSFRAFGNLHSAVYWSLVSGSYRLVDHKMKAEVPKNWRFYYRMIGK